LTGSCAKHGLPATMLGELRKSCDSRPILSRHDALAVITADSGLNHGERRP
jgi:hypothetical protein